nr:amidohydrolase [Oscillospiraceae bacterium]
MRDYLKEIQQFAAELTALRRAFHFHPELGNREYETAARIERWLHDCGIPTRRLLDTAVVGRLRGGREGRTVALRADMDALPLQEATGAAFASEVPGVMHACGHDVHMAAALGAARLLAAQQETLPGEVLFFFQPDEEGNGGAQRMIDAGVLEGVDAVFGCHVAPDLPLGTVAVRYGKFYAASDTFRVTLTGKSAHGAQRELGVDALAAAAELVTALLSLPSAFPHERSVVSVGTLHAGTAG